MTTELEKDLVLGGMAVPPVPQPLVAVSVAPGSPSWSPQISVEEGGERPPHLRALPHVLRAQH